MHDSWVKMQPFKTVYYEPIGNRGYIFDTNPNLENAIICDIDGTLALFGSKNPYDRDFINDEVNPVVKRILTSEHNESPRTDILFSGRDSKFRDETEQWISKHKIPHDFIAMRPEKDSRSDTIVKMEMYEKYVKNKYSILYVIDDRPVVVRMWKKLGLYVLNVGDSIEF